MEVDWLLHLFWFYLELILTSIVNYLEPQGKATFPCLPVFHNAPMILVNSKGDYTCFGVIVQYKMQQMLYYPNYTLLN